MRRDLTFRIRPMLTNCHQADASEAMAARVAPMMSFDTADWSLVMLPRGGSRSGQHDNRSTQTNSSVKVQNVTVLRDEPSDRSMRQREKPKQMPRHKPNRPLHGVGLMVGDQATGDLTA